MEHEVPVLSMSQILLGCTPLAVEPELEAIEELNGLLVFFITEVCRIVGITDNEKAEIPKLSNFIAAQSTYSDCRGTSTSKVVAESRLSADSDGVLVRISSLDGTSQRVSPASLGPRFLHFCHYSLRAGHSGESRMYCFMRKK